MPYYQEGLMSFLKRFFLTLTWLGLKDKKRGLYEKSWKQIWKKGVPCGGWMPSPFEPKLGNVTTGLQGNSLNKLANFNGTYMHITCSFYYSLARILLWKLWHKKNSKACLKLKSFFQIHYWSFLDTESNLSITIRFLRVFSYFIFLFLFLFYI